MKSMTMMLMICGIRMRLMRETRTLAGQGGTRGIPRIGVFGKSTWLLLPPSTRSFCPAKDGANGEGEGLASSVVYARVDEAKSQVLSLAKHHEPRGGDSVTGGVLCSDD